MNDFELYFKLGLNHILSFSSWDHILFLLALIIIFEIKEFKKILVVTGLFSLAHTTSLFLSAFNYIRIDENLIETLIVYTIIITSISNIFIKNRKIIHQTHYVFSLLFGLIHGLGFAKDFKLLIAGQSDVSFPLLEFTLGIEMAQIIVAFVILVFSFVCIKILGIPQKEYIKILSALVIGYSLAHLF